jgi:hypothetical protein
VRDPGRLLWSLSVVATNRLRHMSGARAPGRGSSWNQLPCRDARLSAYAPIGHRLELITDGRDGGEDLGVVHFNGRCVVMGRARQAIGKPLKSSF